MYGITTFLLSAFLFLGVAFPPQAGARQRTPIIEVRQVVPAAAVHDLRVRDAIFAALTNFLKDNFPGCTDLHAFVTITPGGSTALVRVRCFRIDRGLDAPHNYRGGVASLGFFFHARTSRS